MSALTQSRLFIAVFASVALTTVAVCWHIESEQQALFTTIQAQETYGK